MAETFVAVRRGLAGFEQRVCLKRILPSRATDARFVELFLDEARLLAKMHRGNIVQVYDFGEADGTYYMALELVEGADLDALLQAEHGKHLALPVDAAVYVAAELLSALAYAHALQLDGQPLHIIHRDVSPSNILISAHGEVKLTDFGIATARGRLHKTQTGHTKGKPAYMSPEQVRGDPLDQRTDLFSAGVVLYQALTGEHPFDAATDLTLLNNILAGRRRPLLEIDPSLPAELVTLVDALLEVDPAHRPASATDALAMISASVRSIAGQRLLAARVERYITVRAASRAATREVSAHLPYDAARASHHGSTLPVAPHDTLGSSSALGAKHTTGRPLHAEGERRARRLAAATGAGIVFASALGGWVLMRSSTEGFGGEISPGAVAVPSAQVGAQRPASQGEQHHDVLVAPRDDRASALGPQATPSFSLPVASTVGADAGRVAVEQAPHRSDTRRRRPAIAAPRDAGQSTRRWLEVRRDQF